MTTTNTTYRVSLSNGAYWMTVGVDAAGADEAAAIVLAGDTVKRAEIEEAKMAASIGEESSPYAVYKVEISDRDTVGLIDSGAEG
jgi:hypothetical protein